MDEEAPQSADGTDVLAGEVAAALGDRSGAVANSLGHLAANAGGVREFLSTATWQVINGLDNERSLLAVTTDQSDPFLITECLDRIMVDLAALAGLVMESMVRGPGWRFLDLGRRLERAVLLLGVIEATLSDTPDDDVAQPVYDLVLGASESLVAYRRRYRSDVRVAAIEDLLVHDDSNPRSLVFNSTGSTSTSPRCRGTPMHPSIAGSSMLPREDGWERAPSRWRSWCSMCAGRSSS